MKSTLNTLKELWIWIHSPDPKGWVSLIIKTDKDTLKPFVLITDHLYTTYSINIDNLDITETKKYSHFPEPATIPIIELRNDNHLWITFTLEDISREIIIDNEERDIRIKSGMNLLKIRYYNKKLTTIQKI